MADVVINTQTPTGSSESVDVPITFAVTHNVGVDSATITLTLSDALDQSHTPISLGVFDTANGWGGRVVTDGTGFDVVIDVHDPLMPGPWTATATADSTDGGDDGTTSWTFTVVPVIAGVLQLIVDVLEGTEGSTRTVPSGTFRHIDFDHEDIGALGASGPTRPFDLTVIGNASDGSLPSFVSGDYVQDAHRIRISVVYATHPHSMLALEKLIATDNYFIRRSLEWPENWCLMSGWTGCEITGTTTEDISDGESTHLVAVHYDLTISIREIH